MQEGPHAHTAHRCGQSRAGRDLNKTYVVYGAATVTGTGIADTGAGAGAQGAGEIVLCRLTVKEVMCGSTT